MNWRKIAMRWPCDTCLVGPDEPCVTLNGQTKYEVHTARSVLASANNWKDPELETAN